MAAALAPLSTGIIIATLALVAYDGLLTRIEKLAGALDRLGAETIDAIALTAPISSPAITLAPMRRSGPNAPSVVVAQGIPGRFARTSRPASRRLLTGRGTPRGPSGEKPTVLAHVRRALVGYDSSVKGGSLYARPPIAREYQLVPDPEPAEAQRSNLMTGLDLESFLLLLRADLTTWMVLGLATLVLALMVWSCWRSRRALRNCLVLSLAAHLGLVLYGSAIPAVLWSAGSHRRAATNRTHLRQVRVAPLVDSNPSNREPHGGDSITRDSTTKRWDLPPAPPALADESIKVARPKIDDESRPIRESEFKLPPLTATADVTPRGKDLAPRHGPPRYPAGTDLEGKQPARSHNDLPCRLG